MPQGHHHHENKRDKSNTKLMRLARHKRGVIVEDAVVPAIDLGISTFEISDIIRGVTNGHEDAFQEAWLLVLERKLSDAAAIREVAHQCLTKEIRAPIIDDYRGVSLDAPLRPGEETSGTLLDVLSAVGDRTEEDIDAEIESCAPRYRGQGRRNVEGHTQIDRETLLAIQKMYPHEPLNYAIRRLAGLPPPEPKHRPWAQWEDALLRRRYCWGGVFACMMDLNRSRQAIQQRANKLGLHLTGKAYKPMPEWMRIEEAAETLGASYKTVVRWIKLGYLSVVDVEGHRQPGRDIFITPEAVQAFLQSFPCVYDPRAVAAEFAADIPEERGDWCTTKEASVAVGINQTSIDRGIKAGDLEAVWGWLGRWYVRLKDVGYWATQPYPVVWRFDGSRHYLFHMDEQGNQYTYCRKRNPTRELQRSEKKGEFPTCLVCLRALGIYRKEHRKQEPATFYKPKECLICRKPALEGKSLCIDCDREVWHRYGRCVFCEEPRIPGRYLCERHQAEQAKESRVVRPSKNVQAALRILRQLSARYSERKRPLKQGDTRTLASIQEAISFLEKEYRRP